MFIDTDITLIKASVQSTWQQFIIKGIVTCVRCDSVHGKYNHVFKNISHRGTDQMQCEKMQCKHGSFQFVLQGRFSRVRFVCECPKNVQSSGHTDIKRSFTSTSSMLDCQESFLFSCEIHVFGDMSCIQRNQQLVVKPLLNPSLDPHESTVRKKKQINHHTDYTC